MALTTDTAGVLLGVRTAGSPEQGEHLQAVRAFWRHRVRIEPGTIFTAARGEAAELIHAGKALRVDPTVRIKPRRAPAPRETAPPAPSLED